MRATRAGVDSFLASLDAQRSLYAARRNAEDRDGPAGRPDPHRPVPRAWRRQQRGVRGALRAQSRRESRLRLTASVRSRANRTNQEHYARVVFLSRRAAPTRRPASPMAALPVRQGRWRLAGDGHADFDAAIGGGLAIGRRMNFRSRRARCDERRRLCRVARCAGAAPLLWLRTADAARRAGHIYARRHRRAWRRPRPAAARRNRRPQNAPRLRQ